MRIFGEAYAESAGIIARFVVVTPFVIASFDRSQVTLDARTRRHTRVSNEREHVLNARIYTPLQTLWPVTLKAGLHRANRRHTIPDE